MAAPEREGSAQPLRRLSRIGLHELSGVANSLLEANRIDLRGIGRQAVAAVVTDDDVADGSSQVRDVRLKRRARRGRRLFSPNTIDQCIDRHALADIGGQQRKHGPLLPSPETDADAVAPNLERAK